MRWAALALAACVEAPAPEPMPAGDVATFAATVQPVLDARCADPSCHGRADRPLSVYSPLQYRLDPTRRYLNEPLSDDELAANAREVAAFAADADAVEDVLVLRKPLPVAIGGAWHGGGAIFASWDDREVRALRAWLAPLVEGAP